MVRGLSSCGVRAPEHVGSVAAARGLSCPTACGILVPPPGIEPMSPALEGRFLPTGPPGKSQSLSFFFNKLKKYIYLFIYLWLHWVFVAMHRLSLVAASGGYSSLWCAGFSCCGARALGAPASVAVARGLSSSGSQALECRLSSCGAQV